MGSPARLGLAVLLCLLLWVGGLPGADGAEPQVRIAVVTGPKPPNLALDRATLRQIFLKQVVIDGAGRPLIPLNLPPDNPMRAAFSQALLGKAPDAMQRFWTERYFQGVSPPYVVRSEEAVLRFVAETPGAIGYVTSCKSNGRVQVVAELPVPPQWSDALSALCREESASR